MHVSLVADIIGSAGVAILLLAFLLSLIGRMSASSKPYLTLNAIGAGLACFSSWLIGFMPFVVLEGTWAAVAVLSLARQFSGRAGSST